MFFGYLVVSLERHAHCWYRDRAFQLKKKASVDVKMKYLATNQRCVCFIKNYKVTFFLVTEYWRREREKLIMLTRKTITCNVCLQRCHIVIFVGSVKPSGQGGRVAESPDSRDFLKINPTKQSHRYLWLWTKFWNHATIKYVQKWGKS
jgi:hypothetical protein